MNGWIRALFAVAALYDGLTGIGFLLGAEWIFAWWGTEPPNHMSYIQFPALLLIIFATMFGRISADPPGNRSLIPYGIAMKAAYAGTVFYHLYTQPRGIGFMWVPWAWVDLVFLALFVLAWRSLYKAGRN